MRRNITSILKFMCLCVFTVMLTVFLYKTFFMLQNMYDDGNNVGRRRNDVHFHPRQGAFFMGNVKNDRKLKIDWHDYKYIEYERNRAGVGEHGVPSYTEPEEEPERMRLFADNGFNGYLSDKISLNRSVADIRHKE